LAVTPIYGDDLEAYFKSKKEVITIAIVLFVAFICKFFQIEASDVDFWGGNTQQMELKHKTKVYPPSVTVHIYSDVPGSRKSKVTLEVSGMKDEPSTITVVKQFTFG
jgi:hypothetical protein